jgi:hypothetical protein
VKSIKNTARYNRQVEFQDKSGGSLRATYFGVSRRLEDTEAFAMLHRGQPMEALDE